jgi:4-alpha-glucanotransferase
MAEASILSYRVLYFEQDPETGDFLPPDAYPELALAVISSHDLPTLRGWWEGHDVDLKERLGLYRDEEEATRQRERRRRDREKLLAVLRREGLIESEGEPEIPILARAAHTFMARNRSALALAQIDDLTDEIEPVNVPATSDEHPNWRRRLSMTLEEMAARPRSVDIMARFARERGAAPAREGEGNG